MNTKSILLFLSLVIISAANALAAEDARPVVDDSQFAVEKAASNKLPTLFIVGDSTLKSNAPLRGWGQEIAAFFDSKKINVINRAIGGRSSRTFQTDGKWDSMLAEIKSGDFVLVQFGHNDVGQYDDPRSKGRPSLHGAGEETAEVTKPDGTTETVHTFGWYMRKYGADAKAKGASVIFCSMVPHKNWKDGKVMRSEHDTFVKWTAEAAKATGAAFIDLNEIVGREYEKLGQEKVESLFADKGTHTSVEGAKVNAAAVIAGLKSLKPNPIEKYFSKQAAAVAAAPSR